MYFESSNNLNKRKNLKKRIENKKSKNSSTFVILILIRVILVLITILAQLLIDIIDSDDGPIPKNLLRIH